VLSESVSISFCVLLYVALSCKFLVFSLLWCSYSLLISRNRCVFVFLCCVFVFLCFLCFCVFCVWFVLVVVCVAECCPVFFVSVCFVCVCLCVLLCLCVEGLT